MADDDEVVEVSCGGDPGAYAAVLKRKLDLYCAAVAKSMETKSQESSWGYTNSSQASDTSQLISQASGTSLLISQASDTSQLISQASFNGDVDEASLFRNSHILDNAVSQGNPASTGVSKGQLDDDDDLETMNPANARKIRRLLLNRESARRSRKRKQIHIDDLESQVSRLTAENASLLKRLTDMTQKYKDATLENRHIIDGVEMMRRKVHIAEEAVRRVTGASMLLPPTSSNMPVSSMPLTSCASDAPYVAVTVQESVQHFLQAPLHVDQIKLDLPNATIPREMVTMAVSLREVGEPAEEDPQRFSTFWDCTATLGS